MPASVAQVDSLGPIHPGDVLSVFRAGAAHPMGMAIGGGTPSIRALCGGLLLPAAAPQQINRSRRCAGLIRPRTRRPRARIRAMMRRNHMNRSLSPQGHIAVRRAGATALSQAPGSRGRQLLFRGPAQHARSVSGEREHGQAELADPSRLDVGVDIAVRRNDFDRSLSEAGSVRRHGQKGNEAGSPITFRWG
jgi:hypothetical protein